MIKFKILAFLFLCLFVSLSTNLYSQDVAEPIIDNMKSRVKDAYGSGQYGASRDKSTRIHKGLDIIVKADEKIYTPFKGDVVREAVPYKDDKSFRGLVLKGKDKWEGYEMKIFYVEGLFTGEALKGQELGTAQDLKLRYPTITNHIHVEVKRFGIQLDV